MWIGHRNESLKLTFRELALHQIGKLGFGPVLDKAIYYFPWKTFSCFTEPYGWISTSALIDSFLIIQRSRLGKISEDVY